MEVLVPTNEPLELRAGTTWSWRREDLSDYPASAGWALKYWFKKYGGTANFSIDAAADGDAFVASRAAADTQALAAGKWTWVAQVSKAAEIYDVDKGILEILPRYDQAQNLDDRSHARKMLEAIEAALEGRATASQLDLISLSIGSRAQQRDVAKLLPLRDMYRREVQNEEAALAVASGLPNPRLVRVRFNRA
jgi:hypothetical protein